MYTIDTFIERLKDLREVAKNGGDTPITIACSDDFVKKGISYASFEVAAAELEKVTSVPECGNGTKWISRPEPENNEEEVLNIF
jgi:hypothetical protein